MRCKTLDKNKTASTSFNSFTLIYCLFLYYIKSTLHINVLGDTSDEKQFELNVTSASIGNRILKATDM